MPITKLTTNIDKVSHIVHVADIHIRLTKRHEEYEKIFDRLYKEVASQDKNTVVCLLGDIFHNKSELSPECIQSAKDLLWNLAELRPTILVAGNHDATLTNRNRLDSLSPLVDALNHSNLHYLRESGLYSLGNVLFNNMSVFDTPDKYIRFKDIPTVHKNSHERFLALFHGPVNNALTDLGYMITSKSHPTAMFEGHDIALLGDIHMLQDLQYYDPDEGMPFIHYAGSLIQQNHGESLTGHGYSLWDLNNIAYKHVEIPNDYGHFTIDIEKGKLNTDLTNIPKKARLRIRCFESVATEVKAVLASVRKVADITDVVYVRVSSPTDHKNPKAGSILSGDLTDVEYQNKLITDHLKKQLDVKDKSVIEGVLKVNNKTNTQIKKDEFSRNIRWKPKVFEFDNMFSYGEGNVIDFSKLSDVVGVFAANASGKSSILSALSFCIFDKCDRAFKASYILNNQKMSFRCKFNFEIDGVDYFVERSGKADKKGSVPVTVKFWKEVNGEEIELHGEGRRDTNEVIRDYLGSYDDFILTTLSVQNAKNNASFIDMGHSERKDLLSQFIGLTIFDRLYNIAYERNKELAILLRDYKNDDFTKKLVELNNALSAATSAYTSASTELTKLNEERQTANDQIVLTSKKFVSTSLEVVNLKELEANKEKLNKRITKEKADLKERADKAELLLKDIRFHEKTIEELVNKNTEAAHKNFEKVTESWKQLKQEVDKKKIEIKGKLDKLEKLSKHEYDPNCRYCVNNEFVKDALKTKEELPNDKVETSQLLQKLAELDAGRSHWFYAVEDFSQLGLNKEKLAEKRETHNESCAGVAKSEKLLGQLDLDLQEVERKIAFYHNHQKDIESNISIQKEVDVLNQTLKNIEVQIRGVNKTMLEMNGKTTVLKTQIEEIKKKVDKAKTLETEYESYNLYIQCVGRDGIPYEVISVTVPEIEREVNNILSQIVEFNIELESDGKNITPFIVYDKNRWALELSSGLERFISSLAIRVALVNISNLPRPNFLVIDEGFGCADGDNLAAMNTLFAYLKTNFDFVMIVSHLDALKDMVDKHIEIQKEGGFSKVNFI
jgi:DNA repair exonuclease SbcCD ATPase subunit